MPQLNHRALMCKLSKTTTTKKNYNSIPVVEDGAKREGVVLSMMNVA